MEKLRHHTKVQGLSVIAASLQANQETPSLKRSILTKIALLVFIATTSGCASMSYHETTEYEKMEAAGVECEAVVSPILAGALNIFPGFGDIYLASGDYGNGGPSWGAFTLDLLLWTPSVVWAVPQAAITANSINKKACVAAHSGNSFNNNPTPPILKTAHSGNQWSNGVEFGTFNEGTPSERVKKPGQIPIIIEGSPEYRDRY